MVCILGSGAEQAPRVFAVFAELLETDAKDVKGLTTYSASCIPVSVSKKLAARFTAQHGARAIPVANDAESADIEHLGKRGVVVPEALRSVLSTTVGSLDNVKKALCQEVTKTYSFSQLPAAARRNLETAVNTVTAAGEPVTLAEVDVCDFRSESLLGQFKGRRILLARRIVNDAKETLSTLVHEVAHRHGRDGDKGHVEAIEDLWSAIVANLLAAPVTAPAKPVTAKPVTAKKPASPTTQYGRVGTTAESYKRLILTNADADDAAIHAAVTAELGAAKAGPKSYVGWYRNWLKKHGQTASTPAVEAPAAAPAAEAPAVITAAPAVITDASTAALAATTTSKRARRAA
jgi:hypothetical protein